ncbi:hypothetical protein EDB85DRAFT_1990770 [Lactarius pseudohatsudake]|nr:hypothetical protein EDB85DRAFT_1990770 [Lactarius pseudohatsudake]
MCLGVFGIASFEIIGLASRPEVPKSAYQKIVGALNFVTCSDDTARLSKASLHFCSECNNLLYPKQSKQRRTMVYACRIARASTRPEQAGVTTDLGQDPTLAHTNIACPNCGHEDAVFYQDQSKRKETRMILFYVCTRTAER